MCEGKRENTGGVLELIAGLGARVCVYSAVRFDILNCPGKEVGFCAGGAESFFVLIS